MITQQVESWRQPLPAIREKGADVYPLPSLKAIKKRFANHDMAVNRSVVCPVTMAKKWAYATSPIMKGGSHNHFDNKADLYNFLLQVERVASCNE